MHLPYDKATWGIILAVAAIILAFPLSLVANLVTPKIRNGWAQRSVTALRERISKLERELTILETYDLLTGSEEIVMLTLLRAGKMVGLSLGFVIGMATYFMLKHTHHFVLVLLFSMVALIILASMAMYVFGPATTCWNLRSFEAREQIKQDILRLSVKLANPPK